MVSRNTVACLIAFALACGASAQDGAQAAGTPDAAQESRLPTVSASATAGQLLKRAAAQANPKEVALTLRTVLDDWAQSLAPTLGADTHLFTCAGAAAEAMLFSNTAAGEQFRALEESNAQQLVKSGALETAAATRLATMAGLDAALRLAQSNLANGRPAAACALLERVQHHPGLTGRAALHQRAMRVIALSQLDSPIAARAAFASLEADARKELAGTAADALLSTPRKELERAAQPSGEQPTPKWTELWREPLQSWAQRAAAPQDPVPPAVPAGPGVPVVPVVPGMPAAPGVAPGAGMPAAFALNRRGAAARALPSADSARVYVVDGAGIGAWDVLDGNSLWHEPIGAQAPANPLAPSLQCTAAGAGAVVCFAWEPTGAGDTPSPQVQCRDAASGVLRWAQGLGMSASNEGGTVGAIPVGQPLIVDGRVMVCARQVTASMESVSWVVCFDLFDATAPLWTTQIASARGDFHPAVQALESPVLWQGGIYVCTGTGAMARLDPGTGALAWLRQFSLPAADPRPRASPCEMLTPAIAGQRVLAVAPSRTEIAVMDCASGTLLQTLDAGANTPLRGTAYLLGNGEGDTVAAVGDGVALFKGSDPVHVAWRWPEGNSSERPTGRVALSTVVAVPHDDWMLVAPVADPSKGVELDAQGNAALQADALAAAANMQMTCLMPASVALARCTQRMQADTSVAAALACMRACIRAGAAGPGVEAAHQVQKRVGELSKDQPDAEALAELQQEYLEQLLALQGAVTAADPSHAQLDSLIAAAAAECRQPQRAQLAHAALERRRGNASAAATLTTQALLACAAAEPGAAPPAIRTDDGWVSVQAVGMTQLAELLRQDTSAAVAAVTKELAQALKSAGNAPLLRQIARMAAAATDAGLEQQAVKQLQAIDAPLAARVQHELALVPQPATRSAAAPATSLEFPGRLCATAQTMPPLHDQLFTMADEQLVVRRAPDFAVAWTAKLGAPAATVVGLGRSLLVWEQRSGSAQCAATALDARTGSLVWRNQQLGQQFVPREPVGAVTSQSEVTLISGAAAPMGEIVPALCGSTLLLVRRDGAVVAVDAADGTTKRWDRRGSDDSVVAFAADGTSVVLGTAQRDGPDAVTFTTQPHVAAYDARTGAEIMRTAVSGGIVPELQWVLMAPNGLLVFGTDLGVQAWRMAGGDGAVPYWQTTSAELQYSVQAWSAQQWLLVQAAHGEVIAIDRSSGRIHPTAFRADDAPLGNVRSVQQGPGWVAVVRDSGVDFFTPSGGFLGRDAVSEDRTVTFAIPCGDQLVTIDAESDRLAQVAAQQYGVELLRLEARSGGKILDSAYSVTMDRAPVNTAVAMDGWIVLSNGFAVQAVAISPPVTQ